MTYKLALNGFGLVIDKRQMKDIHLSYVMSYGHSHSQFLEGLG